MNSFHLPFAGICKRPYSQDFLSNVDRHVIKPRIIEFKELWLTQEILNIEGIFGKRYSSDAIPHVVAYKGTFYLEDGTHRLVIRAIKGNDRSLMRVIDWERYNGN